MRLTAPCRYVLRSSISFALAAVVAICLGLASSPAQAQDSQRDSAVVGRPNVLFLFSDDQRYDTIAALGHPEIKTPNIDKLVNNGFAFTHAFCQGSTSGAVCIPSRAMLMSGRSVFHAKHQLQDQTTFPQRMRRDGYYTFGTGKWHSGKPSYARSFDNGGGIFFGGMSNHEKVPVFDFQADGKYPNELRSFGEKFSSELFANEAVDFLKSDAAGEKPFMMYVSFTAPHDPRMPPGDYASMYDPDELSLPENFMPEHPFDNGELKIRDEALAPWPRTPEIVRQHLAEYYGMISHMDAQIGRVLQALDESGQAENTLIVFAGDHGLAVGQHGLLGKQNVYDHSVRAPLVFSGPGIPHGKSDALCYLYDIFPTIFDLCGLPPLQEAEGQSLAPVIRGQRSTARGELFCIYKDLQRMARTDQWKIIEYPKIGVTQLFDIQADPHELHNLAESEDHKDELQRMQSLLDKLQVEFDDPLLSPTADGGQ